MLWVSIVFFAFLSFLNPRENMDEQQKVLCLESFLMSHFGDIWNQKQIVWTSYKV